ncbi:MAG: hypothetical protein Q8O67_19625 [Deltaproteobacteria bacterium]|nr:hypothetical protein [Deltaproteobacteria bacterium]
MKFTPKLPQTVADSLKLKKPEPSLLVKARTHESKAEKLRAQDEVAHREQLGPQKKPSALPNVRRPDSREKPEKKIEAPRPHLEYLERWKVLDAALGPISEKTQKEYAAKLGEEPKTHQVLGHLIGSLPRPRLDALMHDPRLPLLNVALGHRPLQKIVADNELLQDLGIGWLTFVDAKRDLKFQLGIQSYKSAQAIALYLTVIRAAVDPKVRKTANLVTDVEILDLAKDLLREVTTHLIAEMQDAHDSFFAIGDRSTQGEQFRIDKAKKSGRAVPEANAPKGRPTLKTDKNEPLRPSPGARKA